MYAPRGRGGGVKNPKNLVDVLNGSSFTRAHVSNSKIDLGQALGQILGLEKCDNLHFDLHWSQLKQDAFLLLCYLT